MGLTFMIASSILCCFERAPPAGFFAAFCGCIFGLGGIAAMNVSQRFWLGVIRDFRQIRRAPDPASTDGGFGGA
jgi:hypothetical protein